MPFPLADLIPGVGPALSAVGNLIGTVATNKANVNIANATNQWNYKTFQEQNAFNERMQDKANSFNAQQQELQNNFQREMSGNQTAFQVHGARAAGINATAALSGNMSAPSTGVNSPVGSAQASSANIPSFATPTMMAPDVSALSALADIRLKNAQSENLEQDASGKKIDNQNKPEYWKNELNRIKQEGDLLQRQFDKTTEEVFNLATERNKIGADIDKTRAETESINQMTKNQKDYYEQLVKNMLQEYDLNIKRLENETKHANAAVMQAKAAKLQAEAAARVASATVKMLNSQRANLDAQTEKAYAEAFESYMRGDLNEYEAKMKAIEYNIEKDKPSWWQTGRSYVRDITNTIGQLLGGSFGVTKVVK